MFFNHLDPILVHSGGEPTSLQKSVLKCFQLTERHMQWQELVSSTIPIDLGMQMVLFVLNRKFQVVWMAKTIHNKGE